MMPEWGRAALLASGPATAMSRNVVSGHVCRGWAANRRSQPLAGGRLREAAGIWPSAGRGRADER